MHLKMLSENLAAILSWPQCINAANLCVFQVIKTTGFMKGLYTDAEMNSENVKVNEWF